MLAGNNQSTRALKSLPPPLVDAAAPCACGHLDCAGFKECRRKTARADWSKYAALKQLDGTATAGAANRVSANANNRPVTQAALRQTAIRPAAYAGFLIDDPTGHAPKRVLPERVLPTGRAQPVERVNFHDVSAPATIAGSFTPLRPAYAGVGFTEDAPVRESAQPGKRHFNFKAFAAGLTTGFAVKAAFMIAATSLTAPGAAGVSVLMLAGSALSSVAATYATSLVTGEKLEKGWWKQSAARGLKWGVAFALGGSVGMVALAAAAHIVSAADTLITHGVQHAADLVRAHLPGGHTHVAPASMAHGVPAAPSASEMLATFTRSAPFHHLPASLKNLGLDAAKTNDPAKMLHFYKEASYHEMLHGSHETGAMLINRGADLANHLNAQHMLTTKMATTAHMLIRDQQYLEKIGMSAHITNTHGMDMHGMGGNAMANAVHAPRLMNASLRIPLPFDMHNFPRGFGHVSSDFGTRAGEHGGIDFPAREGTPIYAASSGTIEKAGWLGRGVHSYGNCVEVKNGDGTETLYGHLSAFARGPDGQPLHAGSTVENGQLIGYVGHTGHASGAHLHFEVRDNVIPKKPVPENPRAYFGRSNLGLATMVFQ